MREVAQTVGDLEKHLRDQIGFLQRSTAAYDEGYLGEAKRLAVVSRVLVHDTRRSRSLLGQLGLKDALRFYDTSQPYNPANIFSHCGLAIVMVSPEEGGTFVPLCLAPPFPWARSPRRVAFDEWWDAMVVKDQTGSRFSRQELVLNVCNKEGGAHVDPSLDAEYAALTRSNTMGYSYDIGHMAGDIHGIELASVRQIAYEVLLSLSEQLPQYF